MPKDTKIIVINGYPRSGKDEFVKIADEKYKVVQLSTVDTVKYVAKIFGWDGKKDRISRKMLSDLKLFYSKHFNGPYKECTELIESGRGIYDIVFLHVREPNEIECIKMYCRAADIKFYSLFIDRNDSEKTHLAKSDTQVQEYTYDIVVRNNGTLDEYKNTVYNTIKEKII